MATDGEDCVARGEAEGTLGAQKLGLNFGALNMIFLRVKKIRLGEFHTGLVPEFLIFSKAPLYAPC